MAVGLDTSNAPKAYLNSLRITSAEDLAKEEEQAILSSRPASEPVSGLVSHVRGVFQRHKTGRLDIEREMLKTLRRIKREYEADKLTAIRAIGDPEVYTGHTAQKVDDAQAWIMDILNQDADRTWDIEPTSVADIPPDILAVIHDNVKLQIVRDVLLQAQETGEFPTPEEIMTAYNAQRQKVEDDVRRQAQDLAEERSANMERLIQDQLDEGGWSNAFRAIVSDFCNFKLCCLKGPIFRKRKALKWGQNPSTGKWVPQVRDEIRPEFARVAPFDWYPAPDSISAGDGDEIEIEHVSRGDLQDLIGLPGYKSDTIELVMQNYPNGFKEMTVIDSERHLLEKQNTLSLMDSRKYDIVNFWGRVPGQYLLDWGIEREKIPNPHLDYEVNVKIIGGYCIKAVLNPDPLNKHPYKTTSYRKSNDSQWGECPGDMMEHLQDQLNLAARSLNANLAWSSGPVTELDIDRTRLPGEIPEVWPRKTILSTDVQMQSGKPAVRFYQPNNHSQSILAVLEKLERIADDTVVPSYGSANKGGPAGKTAAGLSMLRTDSARKLKLAMQNIDSDIIIPTIEQLFNYNMRFLDDDSIKGDCKVRARGTASIMAKEQIALRRNEYLGLVLGSDVLKEIHTKKGITYMAGEAVKSVEMDIAKAIPDRDEIERLPANAMPSLPEQQTISAPPRGRELDVAGNPKGVGLRMPGNRMMAGGAR